MDRLQPYMPEIHTVSIGVVAATIAGWLPPIAALLSIIWFIICIYESKTYQSWRRRAAESKREKRLNALRAKLNRLEKE